MAESEYNKGMNKFINGTGSGAYDPVNWDNRDALVIRDHHFMREYKDDYITFIHMYDTTEKLFIYQRKTGYPGQYCVGRWERW